MGKRYKTDDVSLGIGNRIRELRLRTRRPDGKKMNQEEFYGFLGCDTGRTNNSNQGRQSELENAVQPPSPTELIALSRKCGVSIDWILTGKESGGKPLPRKETSVSDCCRELVHIITCCNMRLDISEVFDRVNLSFATIYDDPEFLDYPPPFIFNSAVMQFLKNYYSLKSLPIDDATKKSLIETLFEKADDYISGNEIPLETSFEEVDDIV